MNPLALAGIALAGATLGKKISAAPTAADLKRLQRKIERDRLQAQELQLVESVQAGLAEDRMLAFVAEQEAAGQQHQITTSVIRILPWALGGVAVLITGALLLRGKKKRKKRRK